MKAVLAVDQSTSATKALLFSLDGSLIDQYSIAHQQIYPKPGWVEHDPEEIYRNLIQAVSNLLDQNSAEDYQLLCLSLTNQRETIIVFDRETGRPLYNALVWQCRRGSQICEQLVADGKSEIVRTRTGLPIDTYFSASKLKWLMDNQPDIKKKLENGEALVGTVETYLIYRLTQGRVFASDPTNACRTLLFNIQSLKWDPELCEIFNLPYHSLPEIRESSDVFGETDLEGTLSEPIQICGVMGDSQAALFAQRCYQTGNAKITFGTGSSVLLNIGREMKMSDSGIVTTLAYVYRGEPVYAFEGITNFTGGTIDWLKNQLEIIQDPGETEALARSVPDNEGVYLVPAFVGLSAPYWQPDAKAAVLGLTPHSTKAHLVRAGLESIAYRIRDVLVLMADDAGVELKEVHADGGAVKNIFLMQFTADILQMTVRASKLAELSALGAVYSGFLGLQLLESLEDLGGLPADFTEYLSEMDPERVKELVSGWQASVRKVLNSSREG